MKMNDIYERLKGRETSLAVVGEIKWKIYIGF